MSERQTENPEFAQIVLSMPAARHLGFSFGRVARGEVEIVQPYRVELTEHNGNFQGGVIGSLADFAGGSAAGTLLPAGWVNMTVDYTVKLLAPARGEKLVARGRVVKPGKAITVAAADVFGVDQGEETWCATSLVTMRNIELPLAGNPSPVSPASREGS
ncbi:PaaI family thioesterase [Nocardia sp. NPDC050713]|uniref:PaaI family thioesterase n=1 Tax=Nocardia sp. NPDC050713 TaxID=3154511 RepID=UPI0034044A31